MKKLRRGVTTKHAGVRNLRGELTSTAERAETLAEYFEKVQWQVRFPELLPTASDALGDVLPVCTGDIQESEVCEALRKLKVGKAAGPDQMPPEFWKSLAYSPGARSELVKLCQHCWVEKSIPSTWRRANVVLIFKKGDATLPANYRPISLLAVGYKVLASILHARIIAGGSESRMRSTQFGFRPGRGTSQALMIARRMIDAAHVCDNGGLHLVMLDWAKAFDRLRPDSMRVALLRFGLPTEICDMISAIYAERYFAIVDHSGTSLEHPQPAGIAQGCPLSPYLFIAVQTVMLHDVFKDAPLAAEPPNVITQDLLYADDTLLMSQHPGNLESLLARIVDAGRQYGMELNWDKTVHMPIFSCARVATPDGDNIKTVREAVYLGGLLTCDGKATREITRRLGEAGRLFDALFDVWKHASITRSRKLDIYRTCVLSKLLYSLESLWLLQADRCRLDAFHCRNLRRILRIPPSFVSRVSNKVVLETGKSRALSDLLLDRQKSLYIAISRQPHGSLIKHVVCEADGRPTCWQRRRRRGRPRQMWSQAVYKLVHMAAQ